MPKKKIALNLGYNICILSVKRKQFLQLCKNRTVQNNRFYSGSIAIYRNT